MKKNNDQGLFAEDDHKDDDLDPTPELDSSKEPDEVTRRRVLKSVLSASTLIVINPFLLKAESKVFLVTVTPTPTTSFSLTPTNSRTPSLTPSTSSIPLPVEIAEFGVTEEEGLIKLYWITASEQNNQGFEIQRSTDALLFNKIGWVAGAGNSSSATAYSFEEINVESNQWYYYRLRQIDMNGTNSYSKIVAILINEEEKTTVKDISPTIITENYVNIDIAAGSVDQAEIVINDLHGKLVASKSAWISKGNNTIRIDLPHTPSGLYFVQVKFGKGQIETKRFVVAR